VSELGGDAACWLDRVCDQCGAFLGADEAHECRRPTGASEPPRERPADAERR
jgi:hypothetical protein